MKKNKLKIIKVKKDKEIKIEEEFKPFETEVLIPHYFNELNNNYQILQMELEDKKQKQEATKKYLESNHLLYEQIKENAFKIQEDILNYPSRNSIEKSENISHVYFDFENNTYESSNVFKMPNCYMEDKKNLHICKDNGIYMNAEKYSASKMFLADKNQIDTNLNYISSFEKILDYVITDIDLQGKYKYFCMLPESIDVFNTKIRRCLNTSKGKIISIPKSVAVTYFVGSELGVGDRFCVIDMDGLHPIITQLSIGRDENGNKIILREGFINNSNIKYDYISFANEYLNLYSAKYSVVLTEEEKTNLIYNKDLYEVFINHHTSMIFRENSRINIIYDDDLFNKCIEKFISNCHFDKCSRVYVVSSIRGLITGDYIINIDNSAAFNGLERIREKLLVDENAIIWKERLPKVSLEVIDDNTGRFKVIDLIDELNEGQSIRLSVNEEIELPFRGTITLQKGKKEYYLPLQREIYATDINSEKEAYFFDKSFPLNKDVSVDLIVKYNYMSDSPITIYAIPKIKIEEFSEISNSWVDPHLIESYSGPIYNGHPKNIEKMWKDEAFIIATNNMDRFIRGYARFEAKFFEKDPVGNIYHKDYLFLINNYKSLRTIFDSSNVNEYEFSNFYDEYKVIEFLDKYTELIMNIPSNYSKENVKIYKNGLKRILSDIIVACWYYNPVDTNINKIYEKLAQKKDNIEYLSRLSRCIISKKDDINNVFDKLSSILYKEIIRNNDKNLSFSDKGNNLTTFIRGLSSNCWFNKEWIFNFYCSEKGKECVEEIINLTHKFLMSGEYGHSKKFRDIIEFLVCISRLKEVDKDILNPNKQQTKEMLNILKNSYFDIEQKLGQKNLVSRLTTKNDQGPLYGYPNYIYMLIMTFSGEGQVDLVGYHDD